jgi:hypothetical protein
MRRFVTGVILVAALACGALVLTGCATDSDLPWNTQQGWEGAITIPGVSKD